MNLNNVITSMQNHVGDIYNTIGLTNIEPIDKNIINISPTWRTALLDMMNNGTDTLWENWPKEIGEGTNIQLNNVMKSQRFDYQLKGNIEQGILPDNYQQVEYIESNGNQYIDLLYSPNENIKIACKFAHNESTIDTPVFGCRTGDYKNAYILWSHPSEYGAATIKTTVLFNSLQLSLDRYTQGTVIDFEYDSAGGTYGDQEWTWSPGTGNPQVNMVLFTCRTGTGIDGRKFSGKMWYFKLWDNGTLKRDLIPCYRKTDNVIGMYDMVTGTFYTNQGTGNFTYSNLAPAPESSLDVHTTIGDQEIIITGKNLINIPDKASTTANGIVHKVENQTIFLSGTNTKTDANWSRINYGSGEIVPFPLEIGKTYTIKSTGIWPSGIYFQINARDKYTKSQYALVTCWGGKSTFTVGENFDSIVNVFLGVLKTATAVNGIFKLQLEKGNDATSYKPYVSQSYPINLGNIELCKIGDYQDKIAKSSGKNLCNGINQDYFITPEGMAGVYPNNSGLIIKVDGISKYTISTKVSQTRYRVGCVDVIPTSSTANVQVYNAVIKSNTTDNTTLDTTGHNYILVNVSDLSAIQVEKGSTATSYEPYGKVWYLNKQIGKVVLNGSEEGWGQGNTANGKRNYLAISNILMPSATNIMPNVISDNFTPATSGNTWTQDITAISINNTGSYLLIKLNSSLEIDTLEKFKTWLSNYNTTAYYALAIPTYEKIEDATLLSQLNALELFEGINNIAVNGNLNGIIAVTALEDLQPISAQSEV